MSPFDEVKYSITELMSDVKSFAVTILMFFFRIIICDFFKGCIKICF